MTADTLEIRAPAGNFECLHAAIPGGADSVYFGVGNLNMRSHSANNFSADDLEQVCRICRENGVKSYLTLNIVLYQEDLEPMRETLDAARKAGISAVIASDMAAIAYFHTAEHFQRGVSEILRSIRRRGGAGEGVEPASGQGNTRDHSQGKHMRTFRQTCGDRNVRPRGFVYGHFGEMLSQPARIRGIRQPWFLLSDMPQGL